MSFEIKETCTFHVCVCVNTKMTYTNNSEFLKNNNTFDWPKEYMLVGGRNCLKANTGSHTLDPQFLRIWCGLQPSDPKHEDEALTDSHGVAGAN